MLFYYTQQVLNRQAEGDLDVNDDPEFEDLNWVLQLCHEYLYNIDISMLTFEIYYLYTTWNLCEKL